MKTRKPIINLERRTLTIRVSPEVWKDLEDAALGRPPYRPVRTEKGKIVEEALRFYLANRFRHIPPRSKRKFKNRYLGNDVTSD